MSQISLVYDTRREENIQDLNQHLKMYLANLNTMCQFKYLSRDSAELQRYLTPLLCLQSKIATSTNHANTSKINPNISIFLVVFINEQFVNMRVDQAMGQLKYRISFLYTKCMTTNCDMS